LPSLLLCDFCLTATRFLDSYLRTGREHMLNSTRVLLGRHKDGLIFPLGMLAKVMPSGFGATVQAMPTSDG
jgi:hypothetical protein